MDKYYDESAPINAFITNLGKYNEGALIGQWVSFPTDYETIKQVFKDIGIDGIRYEEFFITDYETKISNLYDMLGEYENLDELNYLATSINDIADHAMPTFEAALEYESCNNIKDVINLTDNLECYHLAGDIHDESDLGEFLIDDGFIEVPDHLRSYIDYEAVGRDWHLDTSGSFTEHGYLEQIDSPREIYDGKEIPEEYCVMSKPADMDISFEKAPKEPERGR